MTDEGDEELDHAPVNLQLVRADGEVVALEATYEGYDEEEGEHVYELVLPLSQAESPTVNFVADYIPPGTVVRVRTS